ncbi:peptidase C14, caspase domain-containing protein [Mycena maculata]|uniref:Peptidase C14, caspase domain-containing protein n=1 Tax=Mycena maculata TaxID=230809 RepID=A0AAD7KKB5_9AGAR|nr:peptidase C14, caspase domain-containing protein [Mycena maculata]
MLSPVTPISRESDAVAPSSSRLCRELQKKALLIGINSLSAPAVDYGLLRGPHQDVAQMKTLLVRTYGYREEDIQILVDDGVYGHVQPDRRNIMIAIGNLVNGAQKGDKLFFQYCGHTIQVPSRSHTEEDGLDECLVPLDGEDRVITDNELRTRLVDTLPVGVSLVAVFDSCHSASLLDLEHTRCNRVFVPWLSKGKRKSDDATAGTGIELPFGFSLVGHEITHHLSVIANLPHAYTFALHLYRLQSHLPSTPESPQSSQSNNTGKRTLESIDTSRSDYERHPAGVRRHNKLLTRKSHIPPPLTLRGDSKENVRADHTLATPGGSQSSKLWDTADTAVNSALSSTGTLCESPVEVFCQGWCRTAENDGLGVMNPRQERADVISLGSCKDSELSWEDEEGVSMTRAMIHILSENPHPTLRDLVTRISHTLHGLARERHLRAKAWKKYREAHAINSSGLGSFDMETFQHPQVASHKPLDMDTAWNI